MDLIIKNRIIAAPITKILYKVKEDCNNSFLDFIGKETNSGVKITCPYHNGGHEKSPDCWVYNKSDNKDIYYGTVHCFACGAKRPLYNLVGYCLGKDDEYGKEWLIDNFGDTLVKKSTYIEPLYNSNEQFKYLDQSILDNYNYIHKYILNRKIEENICVKFKIGYDIENDMITFPIWDENNNLLGINKRSTKGKRYELATGIPKAVYLLNFIENDLKAGKNYPFIIICESQINALTLWSHNLPAVALMGTGSKEQYEILKNSNIKNFILMFDGDIAGRHGAERFIKNMPNNIFITDIVMPHKKDVNDLEYNELEQLLNSYDILWRNNS